MPGIGKKTAEKIAESYRAQSELREIMLWLESHGVSGALAARIYKQYSSFAIDMLESHPYQLAQEVEGIGEVMAASIIRYFHDEQNLRIIERLRGYGLQFALSAEQTMAASDKLKGQSVVISGVFQHHSRDEYKLIIEQNGGKNVGSISSKTSFILAGDNMGPSKLEKAKRLGIRIMSEAEFLEMVNDEG